jgi:guanylate kinase
MVPIGQLFVLSGPSGVGKSSLRERVRERFPELEYSISYTTRAPREGEIEGKDYHFVSKDTFDAMQRADGFVESAEVHGNLYGTSREQLEEHLSKERDVLLEIDVQGARQVKAHFQEACFVFVLPPSEKALAKRLQKRGTEPEEDVIMRLKNASGELLEATWYDYLIINDYLEEAVEALSAIILSARCRRQVVLPRVLGLLRQPEQ